MEIMKALSDIGFCLIMNFIQVCEATAGMGAWVGLIGLCILLNPFVWIAYYIYTRIRNDNQRMEWEKERFEREKLEEKTRLKENTNHEDSVK